MIGGSYEIEVGASVQDIRLSQKLTVDGALLLCTLKKSDGVPLSQKAFDSIYRYPHATFSNPKPGEFTTKNSLLQMQPYSRLARRWIRIGKLYARLAYFPKSIKDPEVRMTLEGILEGNLDSVCNQSRGIVTKKTILKIVESANRGKTV